MKSPLAVGLLLVAVVGCAPGFYSGGSSSVGTGNPLPNPVLVPPCQAEAVWENVVDVVDDYFSIACEEPVREIEGTITGGSLNTYPEVGATFLEPWRRDAANSYERLEDTLQSIRRHAVVRVEPNQHGYEVEVLVYKELEDLAQPAVATAGAATFRYDDSLTRVVNPIEGVPVEMGWIPQGRDTALEQRILGHILARTGSAAVQQ